MRDKSFAILLAGHDGQTALIVTNVPTVAPPNETCNFEKRQNIRTLYKR